MQGPSHLMISWFFAEANEVGAACDRRIVAWSGVAPDGDVIAYVGALVWYRLDQEQAFENVWKVVHHRYTHNLTFVVLTGIAAYWLASRGRGDAGRLKVAALAMVASALHNFCDVVGAGPTWPIYPLWPFSDASWYATWSWTIGDWPNLAILVSLFAATIASGWYAGRSPVECFGDRADRWFVRVLREGSDRPASGAAVTASAWKLRAAIWTALILATIAILAPLGFNPFR